MSLKQLAKEDHTTVFDNISLHSLQINGGKGEISAMYNITKKTKTNEDIVECVPVKIELPCSIPNTKQIRKLTMMAFHMQLINMIPFSKRIEWNFDHAIGEFENDEIFFNKFVGANMTRTFAKKWPDLKTESVMGWHTYPEMNYREYDLNKNKRYLVSMSGGKESTFSYTMLKKLGYKVVPLFFDEGRFKTSQMMYDACCKIEGKENVPVIKTTIFDMFDFIGPHWGKNNVFIPILSIIESIYALATQDEHGDILVFGSEFDATVMVKSHDGQDIFGSNFDQSTVYERCVSQYFKNIGANIQVCSILYNVLGTMIQKMLIENDDYDLYKYQMSCFEPIPSGDDDVPLVPCCNCDKCYRIALIVESVNGNAVDIGLDMVNLEILEMTPEELYNTEDGGEECDMNFYLLNHFKGKKVTNRKIKTAFHESIISFIIDDLHPLIIPGDMYDFMQNTNRNFRKEIEEY